jgi:hypothetical protein
MKGNEPAPVACREDECTIMARISMHLVAETRDPATQFNRMWKILLL